ncbi:MAG: PDZ domain-containing protein [Gammaproteobacteria bacterium]|nr:PDZ domain-containing protein [Gammaproteobacteria bacterium]
MTLFKFTTAIITILGLALLIYLKLDSEVTLPAQASHTNHPILQEESMQHPRERNDLQTKSSDLSQRPSEDETASPSNSDIKNTDHASNERYEEVILYPRFSREKKMEMYINGRPLATVQYPMGLDYQGVEQYSDNVYAINKQRLQEQSQLNDLLSHARFDDTSDGPITVTEVVPGGIFDRIGILPGDKVTGINGFDTHNYAELYSAYENIKNEEQISLHLYRNGQTINFTYFIQ